MYLCSNVVHVFATYTYALCVPYKASTALIEKIASGSHSAHQASYIATLWQPTLSNCNSRGAIEITSNGSLHVHRYSYVHCLPFNFVLRSEGSSPRSMFTSPYIVVIIMCMLYTSCWLGYWGWWVYDFSCSWEFVFHTSAMYALSQWCGHAL